jgi:hypothetical protein
MKEQQSPSDEECQLYIYTVKNTDKSQYKNKYY